MAITSSLVGTDLTPVTTSWTGRDCNLYALAVGAGQADPLEELDYTIDHSERVYPTFAALAADACAIRGMLEVLGDAVDLTQMLHGEEHLEQLAPLPRQATVVTSGQISAIWDKGSSTVVEAMAETVDAETRTAYARTRSVMFFRGVGGWGGERGPSSRNAAPERAPDRVLTAATRSDQALLYRLTGDQNPLHVDPAVAAAAGFPRPILHGMCVYGVVGRHFLASYADHEPARLRSLGVRFSRPTMPGDTLTIRCWDEADGVTFVVVNQSGDLVISNGRFTHDA